MRTWKKVVIGGLTGVTIAGGANMAAMAGTREDNPARQETQAGDIRQEDRRADHDENEARGREAEGENEKGNDNSGPGSADSGPGSTQDDSGHHGRDDG